MNVDTVISKAYNVWKGNVGTLTFVGIFAWLIGMAVGTIITYIGMIFGVEPAESGMGIIVALIASVTMYYVKEAVGIIGDATVYRKPSTISEILENVKKRFLDVAIAAILVTIPLVAGALVGLAVLTLGTVGAIPENIAAPVSTIVVLIGVLLTILFSLAPYYAVEKMWTVAIHEAKERGSKIYITLLLLNIFFALIYITALMLFPDQATSAVFYLILDIAFLMHLKNISFQELTR